MQENRGRRVPVGRVRGHRGRGGEITVRVFTGDAAYWTAVPRVWVGTDEQGHDLRVESSRGYRDRLVLKLAGIDDAGSAEQLRGLTVMVDAELAPRAEPGSWRGALLVGMTVVDESGARIGTVESFLTTGAADLLVVTAADGRGDCLIPLVEAIVVEVDEKQGLLRVRPPEGLLELNRDEESRP